MVIKNTRSLREKMLAGRSARNAVTRDIRLPDASDDAGEDVIVQVRRFELGERAVYFGAPEHMTDRIAKRTKDYATLMSKNGVDIKEGVGEMTAAAFVLLMSQEPEFEDVVNTVCVAAFVDPPLVETEAERSINPDAWMITDLTFGDRTHVFYQLQSKEVKRNKALETFPEESAADVEGAGNQQVVLDSPKRSDGVEGGGLVE